MASQLSESKTKGVPVETILGSSWETLWRQLSVRNPQTVPVNEQTRKWLSFSIVNGVFYRLIEAESEGPDGRMYLIEQDVSAHPADPPRWNQIHILKSERLLQQQTQLTSYANLAELWYLSGTPEPTHILYDRDIQIDPAIIQSLFYEYGKGYERVSAPKPSM